MQTGDSVTLNGQLFVGQGTVVGYCEAPTMAAIGALPAKLQEKLRGNKPFPQMWVRAGNGKLIHYDRADIDAGVVRLTPMTVQQAPTAAAPLGVFSVGGVRIEVYSN